MLSFDKIPYQGLLNLNTFMYTTSYHFFSLNATSHTNTDTDEGDDSEDSISLDISTDLIEISDTELTPRLIYHSKLLNPNVTNPTLKTFTLKTIKS